MAKIHVNFRISEEDKKLLKSLAKQLDFSETDIVKLAIREFAERKGVRQEQEECRDLLPVE